MLTITLTAAIAPHSVIGTLPLGADKREATDLSVTEANQISAQLASHGWTSAPKGWAHQIALGKRKVTREALADAAQQAQRHGDDFALCYLELRTQRPTVDAALSFGGAVDALGGQSAELQSLRPRALDMWEAAMRTRRAYRYASDDHSGVARSVSEIAQAHGLRAETAAELESAFQVAGGYITVTTADGAVVAHVGQ